MTGAFAPGSARRPERDVRLGADLAIPDWVERLFARPNGAAWLVVGNRRQGKTWLVEGLTEVAALKTRTHVKCVAPMSLDQLVQQWTDAGEPRHVFVDEPHRLVPDAEALGRWCRQPPADGVVVVLTLTPREWAAVSSASGWGQSFKDTVSLPPLTNGEAQRMAGRVDWGAEALAAVAASAPSWLRQPLSLEVALAAWERNGFHERADREHLPTVLAEAGATLAKQANVQLGPQVLGNGLDEGQRRRVVHRWFTHVSPGQAAGPPQDATLPTAVTELSCDPMLGCAVLRPPLRIHHLSDLHLGGELPSTVVPGPPGTEAAAAMAGAGSLADAYLRHLAALPEAGRPDLVIVSGDLVDRPTDEGGEAARRFLCELHELIDPQRLDTRLVVVPGNHDVEWPETPGEPPGQRHRWMSDLLEEVAETAALAHPGMDGRTDARCSIDLGGESLRIWMLPTAGVDGELVPPAGSAPLDQRLLTEVMADGYSEDALALMERLNPAVVPAGRLADVASEPALDDWIHVAVTHHPVVPVPNIDLRSFSALVNAGTVLSQCVAGRVSAILSGHAHQGGTSRLSVGDSPWTVRACSAPSLTGVHGTPAGFNALSVLRVGDAPPLIDLRRMAIAPDGSVAQLGSPEVFEPGRPGRLTLDETLDHLCEQWRAYDEDHDGD